MSFCETMMYSSSSNFTSVPEYLEKITLSPSFTCGFSSPFPSATAITVASCGFYFSLSGTRIPVLVLSSYY
jgi:hypothetical protein